MALLLDTHAFLWWVSDASELTKKARTAIGSDQICFVSVASCWEMAIKLSRGRLKLPQTLDRFVSEQMAANGFRPLPITLAATARVATLPFHHSDPFDRLLIAQAMEADLSIVTADQDFKKYDVKRVW